ncbi:MAG: hypothetical protein JWR60_1446 [Polaromonas sp.]|nr:hypothetical protein [Polaromonas sp.]
MNTFDLPAAGPPPRVRSLVHPGPVSPARIQSLQCAQGRHFRLALQPGLSLFDALVGPLAGAGVHSASVSLLGGYLDGVDYCFAGPDPSGRSLAAYCQPVQAGRAYLIFGNAMLGKGADGQPLVHCHAALRTEAGDIRGGHLLPTSCRVGWQPITALVTALDGFELRAIFDPETNLPLFQPRETSPHD